MSYTRADVAWAEWLARHLEAAGYRVLIAAAVCLAIILAPLANAAELWSSVPDPFPCDQASNSCVSHTGFSPTSSYWGQYTNTKGNCTNYAAYRLQRNGAAQLQGNGNAISWRDRVVSQFGAAAVTGTPSVGSIGWWGAKAGDAGHVAYVEKVSGTTIYISESVWDYGSRRRVLTAGTAAYPDAFLHLKFVHSGDLSAMGSISSGPAVQRPNGFVDVFALDSTHQLKHITLTLTAWSAWETLGGGFTGMPTAAARPNGIVDVFAVNELGQLAHRALPPAGWTAWEIIGTGFAGTPAAVVRSNGFVDVFALDTTHRLKHITLTLTAWSAWETLGGGFTDT